MIEKILLKKTLKAGKSVWEEGTILNSPLPPVLLEEIERGTGNVEVLKGNNQQTPKKLIFVAEKVEEVKQEKPSATTVTKTSEVKTKSGALIVNKPRPKLQRRKA